MGCALGAGWEFLGAAGLHLLKAFVHNPDRLLGDVQLQLSESSI